MKYTYLFLIVLCSSLSFDCTKVCKIHMYVICQQIKKLLRENRVNDIVDRNLKNNYDLKEVEIIVQVALLCTQSVPEERPTMTQVVKMLQGVGLAEKWAEWEELEQVRQQEYSLVSLQFPWPEESSMDQEAIQLSTAR